MHNFCNSAKQTCSLYTANSQICGGVQVCRVETTHSKWNYVTEQQPKFYSNSSTSREETLSPLTKTSYVSFTRRCCNTAVKKTCHRSSFAFCLLNQTAASRFPSVRLQLACWCFGSETVVTCNTTAQLFIQIYRCYFLRCWFKGRTILTLHSVFTFYTEPQGGRMAQHSLPLKGLCKKGFIQRILSKIC